MPSDLSLPQTRRASLRTRRGYPGERASALPAPARGGAVARASRIAPERPLPGPSREAGA